MIKKLKKLLQYRPSWKFVMYLNAIFVLCFVVMCICKFHPAYLVGTLVHLCLGMLCHWLCIYDRRNLEDVAAIIMLHERWIHANNRVVIYQRHYGEFTPEMEKELEEEIKQLTEEQSKTEEP